MARPGKSDISSPPTQNVERKSRPSASPRAAELKRRLDQARGRGADASHQGGVDESGIHPLSREREEASVVQGPQLRAPQLSLSRLYAPANEAQRASSPSLGLAPVVVANVPPGHETTTRRWLRMLGMLIAGGVIGVAVARQLAPVIVVTPTVSQHPIEHKPLPFEPVATHGSIRVTTEPAGAELVLRNAVVANTPATVPRPLYEALYLLRRSGYHPQLIRVSPQSGDAIAVTLRPLVADAVTATSRPDVARVKSKPASATRSRGNDVGRQSTPERSHGPAAGGGAR